MDTDKIDERAKTFSRNSLPIKDVMNNITKHSKANLVHLFLRRLEDRMELLLQDNGQGFTPEKELTMESTGRGLGLSSMRERVELSGGSFDIESAKGKGTIIRASWLLSGNN